MKAELTAQPGAVATAAPPTARGGSSQATPRPTGRQLVEEMRARRAQGEPADAHALLTDYPEVADDRQILTDLACAEFSQRLAAGEQLDAAEFAARFPACGPALGDLLATRQFFDDNPDLLADEPGDLSWPEPGDILLGFSLLRELGRGSFSRVYLAYELSVGERLVAVKVSSIDGAFEAEALGSLRHPNIVPVHSLQADAAAGWSVVCMPYHGTATLADVLHRAVGAGGLPARADAILEAVADTSPEGERVAERTEPDALLRRGTYVEGVLHVGAQLADAVAAVHAGKICHRDLKPANVLMTPDGRPMLLDFNLSSDEEAAGQALGGTLPYMAPEQIRGLLDKDGGPHPVDARSDLYALGVMLYELLSGKHPFGPFPPGMSRKELSRRLLERQGRGAVPLRRVNPDVDRAVTEVVDRCLAFDRDRRPGTADGLAAACKRALSVPRRVLRRVKAHRRTVAAAVFLAVAAAAFSAWQAATTDHLAAGERALGERRYDVAAAHFTRALEQADSIRGRFGRGRALYRLGDVHRAIDDLSRADELALGRDGKVQAALGYCFIHPDRLDHNVAVAWYEKAIRSGVTTARVYNNLGYSLLQSARGEQARPFLDLAIREDPRLQAAYHNRLVLTVREGFRVYPPPVDFVPLCGVACVVPRAPSQGHQALDAADMARVRATLLEAAADMRKAIELGTESADLYHDAARLCAIAVAWDGRLGEEGLRYAAKAIELGRTPEFLRADAILQMGLGKLPGFARALAGPVSGRQLVPAVRAVDPIP